MAIKSALYSLVGATALLGLGAGAPALAGGPGYAAGFGCGGVGNCDTGSVYSEPSMAPDYGPTTVRGGTPYDYMSSIRFQRAPHVDITRIHGMGPSASLQDRPHGAVGGCFDHASGYCRAPQARPVQIELFGPQPVQAPLFNAPAFQAPVYQAAPVQAPRVVAIGGGYDPSKFQPRLYGDLSVTPGIVHAPTSIVDRDPQRAQAALDQVAPGSVTPALAGVPIRHGQPYAAPYRLDPVPFAIPADAAPTGVVPGFRPGLAAPSFAQPVMGAPMMSGAAFAAPSFAAPSFNAPMPSVLAGGSIPTGFPGAAGAPIPQADGTYGSRVGADGTYWEKVSGVTKFGDTLATSVICKRKLPTQTVNPVVGVPYPVPTPVAQDCETVPGHLHGYENGHRRY